MVEYAVYGIEYAKKFLKSYNYGCKLWSKYPDLFDLLQEKFYEYRDVISPFILRVGIIKHRKLLLSIADERWTLILIDAYDAAEELEDVLKRNYGMEKDVVVLEVYPYIEKGWRIKKRPMGRRGRPKYFVRRIEKIIEETKGGVFLSVPKEYKSVMEDYFPILQQRYARFIY